MGLFDDVFLSFGKYGPGADHVPLSRIPSSYLRWLLELDWFEREHEDLIETLQEELAWRTQFDSHFEDEADIRY